MEGLREGEKRDQMSEAGNQRPDPLAAGEAGAGENHLALRFIFKMR